MNLSTYVTFRQFESGDMPSCLKQITYTASTDAFFFFYHLVSKLVHLPIVDVDVDDEDAFRSAPGAALPENGLLRLFFISERKPN